MFDGTLIFEKWGGGVQSPRVPKFLHFHIFFKKFWVFAKSIEDPKRRNADSHGRKFLERGIFQLRRLFVRAMKKIEKSRKIFVEKF